MRLYYDYGYTQASYTGNIVGQRWKSALDGVLRSYGYTYDDASRLKGATYRSWGGSSWTGEVDRYSVENLQYDANGNITQLRRRGERSAGVFGLVDDLSYTYSGNRLLRVADQVPHQEGLEDFKQRSGATVAYEYHANGTLARDLNKGMTSSISYNHLQLPMHIPVGIEGSGSLSYVYTAEGEKLEQNVFQGGQLQKTLSYWNGFVYEGGLLQHFRHEEGRFMLHSGSQLLTEFEVRDHLGNVRQVLRSPETQTWMATLEHESAWHEEEDFEHLPESRQQDYRHNSTPGGTQVAWLNAGRGRSLGPVRYQEVQRGQRLRFSVQGKFESPENRLILPFTGGLSTVSSGLASGISVDGGTVFGSGGVGLGFFKPDHKIIF